MEGVFPFVLIGLLILACPLVMGGIGVGAWLIARARGQEKELSTGCMGDHGGHKQPMTDDAGLKEQVARLEREVETLRARVNAAREDAMRPDDRPSTEKVNSHGEQR